MRIFFLFSSHCFIQLNLSSYWRVFAVFTNHYAFGVFAWGQPTEVISKCWSHVHSSYSLQSYRCTLMSTYVTQFISLSLYFSFVEVVLCHFVMPFRIIITIRSTWRKSENWCFIANSGCMQSILHFSIRILRVCTRLLLVVLSSTFDEITKLFRNESGSGIWAFGLAKTKSD